MSAFFSSLFFTIFLSINLFSNDSFYTISICSNLSYKDALYCKNNILRDHLEGLIVPEGLGEEGFDPVYGARPLRRLIQNAIENPISIEIISQKFIAGDTIKVDYDVQKAEYIFVKGTPQATTATGQATTQPGSGDTPPQPPTTGGQENQGSNGQAQSVQQPTSNGNGMVIDPYTPVQNPMTPPPFNPFTADQENRNGVSQPTVGSDGTQMQKDPTQIQ